MAKQALMYLKIYITITIRIHLKPTLICQKKQLQSSQFLQKSLFFCRITTIYKLQFKKSLQLLSAKMYNQKQKDKNIEGESNILVAIRVRPLNQKESNSGDWDIIRIQDNLIIILDPIEKQFENQNKKMLQVYHRSKQQRYAFDKIYRNQSSQQIYDQTVKPLIKTVLSGKNATVFAYGPTGTGKTFTMLGNQQIYGLNVLAIANIFELIQIDQQNDYNVVITYVEIYNEMIRDLLVPTSGYLQLRDDSDKGITIAGVTQFKAESTEQVMNLLLAGNKRRTTEATNANLTSSRSHAVFQINIIKKSKTKSINVETLNGKLSLIDLAGSQRGTVTENRGLRLMEGAKINRSLLALANCINALGDKNKKGFFVPYRDSKLTRLLKDSLGGNCKTVMISNISPASSQFQQTINSLKYANRAKNIKTKAITNKQLVSIHISQYKNIINDLRQQIQQLKLKLQNKGGSNQVEQEIVPIHSGHNYIRKQGQVCHCGRIQQGQEIKRIKEQIFQNFNERIQLRRILMQIEQQNSINFGEIRRKQSQLNSLKQRQIPQNEQEYNKNISEIKKVTQLIYTLKLNSKKNLIKKQITNLKLYESMEMTKKIRQQTNKCIRTKENRDFLDIIIKNHILQLQNIELQINLQIQQRIIQNLNTLSTQNKELIQINKLNINIQDNLIDNQDNIELQLDEEDQIQIQDNEEDQEIEENQIINQKKIKRNKSGNKLKIDEEEKKGDFMKKIKEKNNQNPNIDKNQGGKNFEGLDLNLKGINLKLNEKLPFVMNKQKKKKV